MEEKILVNISEAAKLCGVGRNTMTTWAHQKGFPVFRSGRSVLIPVDSLREWLRAQASGGGDIIGHS